MAKATALTTCLRREPGKLIVELHLEAETEWSVNPDLGQREREDKRAISRAIRLAMAKNKIKGGKIGQAAIGLILALATSRAKPIKVAHQTYDCNFGRPRLEETRLNG